MSISARQSPFMLHEAKIMGHYSTASWLRGAVLAMWNGQDHPVGLSKLATLDAEHFKAFTELVASFRANGENDPAFRAIVEKIQNRLQEEQAAAERNKQLEDWAYEAKQALRAAGHPSNRVDDDYSWFEHQFDVGLTPQLAATTFVSQRAHRFASESHE
jgi:sulfur relay (sulfurtransferase) DsrC/TusE family protein